MGKHVAAVTEIDICKPRENLINHLEGLLEHAKEGELTGIIAVGVWQGGSMSQGWSVKDWQYHRAMIGELEMLKRNLIEENSNA